MDINKELLKTIDDFNFKVNPVKSNQEVWNILESKLSENKNKQTIYFLKPFLSIAASVVIVLMVYFYFTNSTANNKVSYATEGSQIKEYTLPDGSTALLNAKSSITFNAKNWGKNKIVTLDGEAFFKVKKGKRFVVKTSLGEVQVLGTQFNVCDRKNNFEVHCSEGSVKVISGDKSLILKPGETTTRKLGSLLGGKINSNASLCWMENKFCFEEEYLHNILDELGRRFNLTIDYSNTENKTYSGSFDAKTIEEALEFICEPLELKFLKQKNVIYIKSKNYDKSN